MSTKTKKVTYKDPAEDNEDYLEPLQDETQTSIPSRVKPSVRPVRKQPVGYFGSVYLLGSLIFYASVPITQFIMGFIYIGRCTIRQFIPIYMILAGFFGIAFVIVGVVIYMQSLKKASAPYSETASNRTLLKILKPIFIILLLFVIGWFIAGQVIVFQIKTTVELFDPVLPEYCNEHLYKAAYVLIFVDYIVILFAIIFNALTCVSSPDTEEKKKPKRRVRPTRK